MCDKCGACCKNLKNNDLYADLDRGDGICKYLNENNLCAIYETRPDKCNVDKMYELYFKEAFSKDEYNNVNYKACKKLKEKIKEM